MKIIILKKLKLEKKKGNKRISSTSKIKKIIATKKNRKLKGIVLFINVTNPHSNVLEKFWSSITFFLNIYPIIITKILRKLIKVKVIIIKYINFYILNFANLCIKLY